MGPPTVECISVTTPISASAFVFAFVFASAFAGEPSAVAAAASAVVGPSSDHTESSQYPETRQKKITRKSKKKNTLRARTHSSKTRP